MAKNPKANAIVPAVPVSGGIQKARVNPSYAELEKLAQDAMDNRLTAGASFTAWDITRAIRIARPDLEIVHDDVREIVVYRADELALDVAQEDFTNPEEATARVYSISTKQIAGQVTATQKLPAASASSDDETDLGDGQFLLLPGIKSV